LDEGASGKSPPFFGEARYDVETVGGILVGGALGFAYYRFIGCASGACPLTSHPVLSTVYGAVLGALVAGSIR